MHDSYILLVQVRNNNQLLQVEDCQALLDQHPVFHNTQRCASDGEVRNNQYLTN